MLTCTLSAISQLFTTYFSVCFLIVLQLDSLRSELRNPPPTANSATADSAPAAAANEAAAASHASQQQQIEIARLRVELADARAKQHEAQAALKLKTASAVKAGGKSSAIPSQPASRKQPTDLDEDHNNENMADQGNDDLLDDDASAQSGATPRVDRLQRQLTHAQSEAAAIRSKHRQMQAQVKQHLEELERHVSTLQSEHSATSSSSSAGFVFGRKDGGASSTAAKSGVANEGDIEAVRRDLARFQRSAALAESLLKAKADEIFLLQQQLAAAHAFAQHQRAYCDRLCLAVGAHAVAAERHVRTLEVRAARRLASFVSSRLPRCLHTTYLFV
jgi:hypothetical protein